MKEQGKNPPDQTNEEEIGSLPEKEFRVMIVKMIQNLGNRMEKTQETFNKDLEELKSKQTEMNNTINEIKNSLEGVNSRITEAEEQIKSTEYTFFSGAHETFSRIDHILGHKSSLGKFKKIEIISCIFSDHNAMRLDINYRKKICKKYKHMEAKQYTTK